MSHFAYNRASDIGYYVVINAFKGSVLRQARNAIEKFATADLNARFEEGRPQPSGSFQDLIGQYRSATHRFPGRQHNGVVQVLKVDGRSVLERGRRREHLVPMGDNKFRRSFEPVATSIFVQSQGQWFLQGPFGNYVKIRNTKNR